MSEKHIVVKEGKVVEQDGKEWIELVDHEDKKHRIFKAMQDSSGEWIHLDKEVDALKHKIENYSIEGQAYKLKKEKKGNFWNVIGIEEVKDALVKEALAKVVGSNDIVRNKSMALSYAKDLVTAGKIKITELVEYAEVGYRYMIGELTVEDSKVLKIMGGKSETTKVDKDNEDTVEPQKEEVSGDNRRDEDGETDRMQQVKRIEELNKVVKKSKKWLKDNYGTSDITALSNEQLDSLEEYLNEEAY